MLGYFRVGALLALWGNGCAGPHCGVEAPRTGCPDPVWRVALEDTQAGGALLGVWGSSANNVYAVGGALGNGGETLVVHYDGANLTRLHPGGTQTLWWVAGSGASSVWMVGEHGRVLVHDGNAFTERTVDLDVTLFGVWLDAPESAWLVGGTPGVGDAAPNDVVFHWHDGAVERITLPGAPLNRALFKVWGSSAQDIYVVGEAGTVWHRSGETWTLESAQSNPPLSTGRLFTVHGCDAQQVYAVGGRTVLQRLSGQWENAGLTLQSDVNGVNCSGGEVTLVGSGALKMRKTAAGWVDDSFDPPFTELHAVWSDGACSRWAVGGTWATAPHVGVVREGVLARWGGAAPPQSLVP